ncbi:hypothetical protein QE152_g9702 [Popillia japonica]|uniref:Uncharacterized protein n=1 Tax=Popillia japonica TaxID=7064 RepID=A0AAW1LXN6_POPJA
MGRKYVHKLRSAYRRNYEDQKIEDTLALITHFDRLQTCVESPKVHYTTSIRVNMEKLFSKKNKPRKVDNENTTNGELLEAFQNVMQAALKVEDKHAPKRMKKPGVPAGKSVGLDHVETSSNSTSKNQNEMKSEILSNSEEELDSETENETDHLKTDFTSINDIAKNTYIAVSFIYNKGTKKENAKDEQE